MRKVFQLLRFINLRTIYFNLKYLPFNQALKLPFLLSKYVFLREIHGKINLNCPIRFGLIQIGYGNVGVFDKKKSRTVWEVYGDITFSGNAIIGHGSKIIVGPEASLLFGDNFKLTAESSIIAFNKIQFGNECLISWETQIMDTDFHKIKNENGEILNIPKPIIIGNHVWIGSRCTILKGSVIPDNSIIGVNSLVNNELPESNCIYAGIPVKCIKEKVYWEI